MSSDYYDLTTTGVGFINRFRLNKPDQGKPYYSVTLAALHGKANDEGRTKKTYIDCNVVGDALSMVKQIEPYFDGNQEPVIMAKFVIGDLEQRPFQYQSGERKGQTGFALKGRLFDIKWFKAEDKLYYSEAERLRHQEMDGVESPAQSITDDPQPAQDSLPRQVKLVQDDPYFEERKAQLKQQGYRWNSELLLWELHEPAAA